MRLHLKSLWQQVLARICQIRPVTIDDNLRWLKLRSNFWFWCLFVGQISRCWPNQLPDPAFAGSSPSGSFSVFHCLFTNGRLGRWLYPMTVITRSIRIFNLHPPPLSRNLSRIHFSNRPWRIYINKCTKKGVSWRQFTANSRQSLPVPWSDSPKPAIKENIYTLPNLLTLSRILSCPILGWSILDGNYYLSTGLLVYAGFTDWVGVICRPWSFF